MATGPYPPSKKGTHPAAVTLGFLKNMVSRPLAQLTAASTLAGTELFYADDGASDLKVTADQIKDFVGTRDVITASQTYYVSTDGDDDSGDGSIGNPWRTLSFALDYAYYNLDNRGAEVTIQLADGTYAGVLLNGPWPGVTYGPIVQGNSSNPSAVIIEGSNALDIGFYIDDNAAVQLNDLTIATGAAGSFGVYCYGRGRCFLQSGIRFGRCGGAHIRATHGHVDCGPDIEVFDDAPSFIDANLNSYIDIEPTTVTFTGTPDFSDAVVRIRSGSVLHLANATTVVGTATGKAYEFEDFGIVDRSMEGDFEAGNSAGTCENELRTAADYGEVLTLVGHSASAGGPFLSLYHNSSSPASSDESGVFYYANNSAAAEKHMATLYFRNSTVTAGAERSILDIELIANGTLYSALHIRDDRADFRVPIATPKSTLTIATGAVTATRSYHIIDTEGAAASDDLDTINGGVDGMRLVLRAADSARTVVVKDGTGNIQGPGDVTLDNAQDTVELIFDSTLNAWLVVSASNNGA